METVFWGMVRVLSTSLLVYLGIAVALILVGKRKKSASEETTLSFDELFLDDSVPPPLECFVARDGKPLSYRHYPARSDKVLVLLHGSGWHGRYFLPLAEHLSSRGLARVYTPDLRGHGLSPERRGDVDSFDQLEDDLADLVALVRRRHPDALLVVGGHSSGGGLAIRFAGSRYGSQADAYVLLSPFLRYDAPTMRPGAGGWAHAHPLRIAGLTMLNRVGIHRFDGLSVIEFRMPEQARDGTETLSYSHRLNTAYAPRNYKKDLAAVTRPLLVVAGTADEAFVAERFETEIASQGRAQVKLLPDVTHMGVAVGPEVRPVLGAWLNGLQQEHRGQPF